MYISYQKAISMSNILVPYVQDEKKWIEHYVAQARKQLKQEEMTKHICTPKIHPKLVSETTQLAAQSAAEKKRLEKQQTVYAPIKLKPDFETSNSSSSSTKQKGRKRKCSSPLKKSKKKAKNTKKDIFD